MDFVILGFRGPFNYTSKTSGEVAQYYEFSLGEKVKNWDGYRACSAFLRVEKVEGKPAVGAACKGYYNRFGKFDCIVI